MAHKLSEVLCPLPFCSVTYGMVGNMGPCTHNNELTKFQSVDDYWKDPKVVKLQQDMLKGIKNPTCGDCYKKEEMGARSQRQWVSNHTIQNFDYTKVPNLEYLWLRLSNICNFKCIHCHSSTSSLIALEQEKRGIRVPGMHKYHAGPDGIDETAVLNETIKHSDDLKLLAFSGGEPLIHWQHWEILRYCIENDIKPNLKYFTNLSVTKYKQYDLLDTWEHFPHIEAIVGFDADELGNNYFRQNMNFKATLKRIEAVRERIPNIEMPVTATLSWLNAISACKMFEKLTKKYPNWQFNVNTLFHEYIDMRIAPKYMKDRINKQFDSTITTVKSNGFYDLAFKLSNEQNIMNSADWSYKFEEALSWLRDKDEYRNRDFREFFPEIGDIDYNDYRKVSFTPLELPVTAE